MSARRSEGQTLVLFALVLTVLIGFSALVVDIGFKYAAERRYQAVADAASLAGAQDLQTVSRGTPPDVDDRESARTSALRVVLDELIGQGTTWSCPPDVLGDYDDCILPGGVFRVSIRTPSPNCVDCVPARSVQVTIREPEHAVTLARLFGQTTWDLSRTSVAGLTYAPNYTIVALRPPKPRSGSSIEVRDIFLNGGTQVVVSRGDVGTNANMDYASDRITLLDLDDGYRVYYYDPDPAGPAWGGPPTGQHIGTLIADPKYPVPGQPPAPTAEPVSATDPVCRSLVETKILTQPAYADPVSGVVPTDSTGAVEWDKIWCYKPGTYLGEVKDSNAQRLTVLEPGLYYFNGGLDINYALVGGYSKDELGVTLRFPRTEQFFQRAGASVILNAGSKFRNSAGREPAEAPAMTGGDQSLKITLIVEWDNECPVRELYPTGCHDPVGGPGGADKNLTLNLGGGANIYLAGVQYAPSDNIKIAGNTSGADGYVGQIWAWTIEYLGSTTINQEGLQVDGPGIMRIDTACSPGEPQTTCN